MSKFETQLNPPRFLPVAEVSSSGLVFFPFPFFFLMKTPLKTSFFHQKKSNRVLLSPSPSLLRKSAAGLWSQRWLWGQSLAFFGGVFHPFCRFSGRVEALSGGKRAQLKAGTCA